MQTPLAGSWICYNQCWSKKSTADDTSIPVILNHRAASFILKRCNIECVDVKQPCSTSRITEDMYALFGKFPATWSCDCFQISGFSGKLKLPVVPDCEEIFQWLGLGNDTNSSAEKADVPVDTDSNIPLITESMLLTHQVKDNLKNLEQLEGAGCLADSTTMSILQDTALGNVSNCPGRRLEDDESSADSVTKNFTTLENVNFYEMQSGSFSTMMAASGKDTRKNSEQLEGDRCLAGSTTVLIQQGRDMFAVSSDVSDCPERQLDCSTYSVAATTIAMQQDIILDNVSNSALLRNDHDSGPLKRRRTSREMVRDSSRDNSLSYSKDSYSSLGESQRKMLSKDICVPIQNAAILEHLAFKKLVVSSAEMNIRSFVDSRHYMVRDTNSILESTIAYQKESDRLRKAITELTNDAEFDGRKSSIVQSVSRKYHPVNVHGRTRGPLSGTSPYQFHLPNGCSSVPDSWFQYSSFKGVALYHTRDPRCKKAAAFINVSSNSEPVNQYKEAKKALIELIESKMNNNQSENIIDVRKVCNSKLFKGLQHIPLENRFAKYALESGATTAAMRREQLRCNTEAKISHDSTMASTYSRDSTTTFVQPSRVHFDLETVKTWKEEDNE